MPKQGLEKRLSKGPEQGPKQGLEKRLSKGPEQEPKL